MYVQAQEIAEPSVPAVAQADGLQPGKQSALLFIEQAIEQKDGGLEFIGRVEAAAMGVAGEILKLLQFTKNSEIGVGAEDAFQLGQIGDRVTAEMLAQDGWIEEVGRIMLEFSLLAWDSENYNIIN